MDEEPPAANINGELDVSPPTKSAWALPDVSPLAAPKRFFCISIFCLRIAWVC